MGTNDMQIKSKKEDARNIQNKIYMDYAYFIIIIAIVLAPVVLFFLNIIEKIDTEMIALTCASIIAIVMIIFFIKEDKEQLLSLSDRVKIDQFGIFLWNSKMDKELWRVKFQDINRIFWNIDNSNLFAIVYLKNDNGKKMNTKYLDKNKIDDPMFTELLDKTNVTKSNDSISIIQINEYLNKCPQPIKN